MTRPRTLVAIALLGVLLSGCSLFDRGPKAEEAAARLVTGLSAADVSHVSFTAAAGLDLNQWWKDLVKGMDGPPTVRLGKVEENGDKATAALHYAWHLPGGNTWEYDETARLELTDKTWAVVVDDDSFVAPRLGLGKTMSVHTVSPTRGDILGAGDVPLVTPRPVLRIGIDKTKVTAAAQLVASARALAKLVDVALPAYVKQVKAAGSKAFVEAITLRKADAKAAVTAGVAGIPGGVALEGTRPLAPTRDFARPILGTVGPVTAEIVQKSEGVYEAGDEAGISGLESRYDERLRGTPGIVVTGRQADDSSELLYSVEPKPGEPLHTTLDVQLQTEAERLLANVKPARALVAIRPSTGEVLAAASGPGGNGLSTATVGQYAPGSTMKVVSSLALLRAGLRPNSPVTCPPTVVVNGKTFKNYSDYPPGQLGNIDLARAVANSCNTAFIGQRAKVKQQALADAAASLGLGVDHDLGYPVFLGSVPAQAGSETEHAASMIGQGKVLASPIAMASVAASVASGRTVVPTLVSDAAKVTAEPSTPLTRPEAAQLRSLMRGVVTSGSGAFLSDLPGPPVLAKTGTAEFGEQSPPQTHAWMIAVHGDLAVAVFVDVGQSGSRTAGPILESFLRFAF